MTLEDFFTLTEMRDGLSSLARVEELISMIQNLNDSVTSNLGDAVRQWSTVVNVLAVTGNKECLDQFLQLNGLSFLNRWLQDALKFTTDVSSTVVEELICSLLSFFEKSPIEYKWISASGIVTTIKLLLDHKTILVKETAKILYIKWNHAMDDDATHHQDKCGSDHDQAETSQTGNDLVETSQVVQTSDNPVNVVNPEIDVPPSIDGTDEAKCELQSVGTEFQVDNITRSSDSTLAAPIGSTREMVPTSNQVLSAPTNPILADSNPSDSTPVTNSFQGNLSVTEDPSACVEVGQPSSGTCAKLGQGSPEEQHDASVSKDVPPGSVKEMDVDVRENTQYESNQTELCSNPSSLAFSASVTPSVAAAEQVSSCKLDSNNSASEAMDDKLASDHQKEKCLIITKESNPTANLCTDPPNFTNTATIINNSGDLPVSTQPAEATSSVVVKDLDVEVKRKTRKDHFVTSTDFLKVVGNKTKAENGQRSELALECLDDALEVARQVAIAVEKEVVDYREPFCSSPEGNSGETTGSHSPDSEGKQKEPVTEDAGANSSADRKDYSDTSSPEKGSEITENVSSEPDLSEQDIESSKPEVPSSESAGKSIVDRCTFDLNSDICSDEPECLLKPSVKMPTNVSAPVAVVPSSTGAPGLPAALCFGGEMGWKGSAVTSAFRPASPRRTPDPGIKQKSISLEFDLNVAERFDEADDEPVSGNKLPASSSLPYGDSFVEISSRTEKVILDLNQLGDDDTSTYPHSSWKLHSQNGERSLSSASSSSSRQPSRRDFDLNDNPSFPEGGCSYNFSILSTKTSEPHGGSAPYDPVIKIMGSKIAVEKKDNIIQDQQNFLSNGTKVEPAIFPRQLLPCTTSPTAPYGYTGLLAGPTMPVPPAYYPPGTIPYMVDTRGATAFMPHLTGSGGSGLQPARPPFLLGATSVPPSTAGFGSSRPGFDLNSGMALVESGSREGSSSFKQFLWQGHGSWKEEQTNPSSQPSSSAAALKRKEPDTGWETYPHGNKKMTSRQ